MRRWRDLVVSLLIGFAASSVAPSAAAAPSVQIEYGQVLDDVCAILRFSPISGDMRRELLQKLPAFRETWQQTGPATLIKVEELTGKRFTEYEMNVRLTVCDLPSNSFLFGINVNMRHALEWFTDRPVSLRYKANIVTHEILHLFLKQHPPANSALLREHAGEPERVRDHLHLFALMKAAMLDQGQDEALAEMILIDSQLPHPSYRRAWELVNRTPDEYLAYVAEMCRQRP